MLILTGVSIITILVARVQMWLHPIYTYLILLKLLVFLPIIVLFWNAVTGIVFDIAKEKIFKKAENKIKSLNIKTIAITGSYGKSSTKALEMLLQEAIFPS
jgi:UDP-N-acetylmuramyl pentapeptide synthase